MALTFDKRGVGQSGGNWRTVGFEELASDPAAAVAALSARPDDRAFPQLLVDWALRAVGP